MVVQVEYRGPKNLEAIITRCGTIVGNLLGKEKTRLFVMPVDTQGEGEYTPEELVKERLGFDSIEKYFSALKERLTYALPIIFKLERLRKETIEVITAYKQGKKSVEEVLASSKLFALMNSDPEAYKTVLSLIKLCDPDYHQKLVEAGVKDFKGLTDLPKSPFIAVYSDLDAICINAFQFILQIIETKDKERHYPNLIGAMVLEEIWSLPFTSEFRKAVNERRVKEKEIKREYPNAKKIADRLRKNEAIKSSLANEYPNTAIERIADFIIISKYLSSNPEIPPEKRNYWIKYTLRSIEMYKKNDGIIDEFSKKERDLQLEAFKNSLTYLIMGEREIKEGFRLTEEGVAIFTALMGAGFREMSPKAALRKGVEIYRTAYEENTPILEVIARALS